MKYLCLLYYDTAVFAALAPEAAARIGPMCEPYDLDLKTTGRVAVTGSLAMPDAWTTIVPTVEGPRARPGPHGPQPAQAGAFLIVDAETTEQAVEIASRHACANVGEELGFAVEVRPCETYVVTPVD